MAKEVVYTQKKQKRLERHQLEITTKFPAWLQTIAPMSYDDEDLHRIIMFYAIHTPCRGVSANGIPLTQYGWDGLPWNRPGYLKDKLKAVALDEAGSFQVAKKREEMQAACRKARLGANFFEDRIKERVALLDVENNRFMSLFRHIRNALAHGRIAMYPDDQDQSNGDVVFVMEDGRDYGAEFEVRARMVLKKSTLLKWIDILQAGPQEESK